MAKQSASKSYRDVVELFIKHVGENETSFSRWLDTVNLSIKETANYSLLLLGGGLTVLSINQTKSDSFIHNPPYLYSALTLLILAIIYCLVIQYLLVWYLHLRLKHGQNWKAEMLVALNKPETTHKIINDKFGEIGNKPHSKLLEFLKVSNLISTALVAVSLLLLAAAVV